jgi:hypothetical protein
MGLRLAVEHQGIGRGGSWSEAWSGVALTEPAAEKLRRSHPLLAAKLHVAMALRIVEAGKSKYYDAAVANLDAARKLLLQEGRPGEWRALAGDIRERHRRKTGFLSRFERVVDGRSAARPSFLDRARKRWERGAGGGEARS